MTDKKFKIHRTILHFALSFFILIFALYIFTDKSEAAELNLVSSEKIIAFKQEFQVDVSLNTEREEINALEGLITFPQELLELKDIRDGNSVINFWLERPRTETDGKIVFSGITPGGYKSDRGFIFSLIFRAKEQGVGTIHFESARALKNDGQGTGTLLKISNFQFLISKQIPISQIPKPEIKDTDPPESFVPEIANDPTLFDGKYFLAFATQDKGTGIDHYEVREGGWGWFTVTESPYLLKHQSLNKKIFVKAVDKNGNERVVVIEPQNKVSWLMGYEIFGILLLLVVVGFLFKILWSRFIQ